MSEGILDNVTQSGTFYEGVPPEWAAAAQALMMSQPFRRQYYSVYSYGDVRYKLVYHKVCTRQRGLESRTSVQEDCFPPDQEVDTDGQEGRLSQSVSRTKARILEYALCNTWDFFFTGTLDPRKYERSDLSWFRSDLSQWLRNLRRNHGWDIAYLFVPELHSDGQAWHMHGLIRGVPRSDLCRLTSDMVLPVKLLDKLRSGVELYKWPRYQQKFGWVTFSPVRDHCRCASYITKYITKALASSVIEAGAHLYYASQGLEGRTLIYEGDGVKAPDRPPPGERTIVPESDEWDFENDYVCIKWAESPEYWLKGG